MRKIRWAFFWGGIFILFYVCLGPMSAWAEEEHSQGVTRIAVMPFFRGEEPANVEAVLNCSMERFCPEQVDVAHRGEKVVTDISWNAIHRRYNERVVPQTEAWEVFSRMRAFKSSETPRELAVRFGRALDASHVILGNVWRFKEKVFEEEKPASVAFSMYLLNMNTGRRIWRSRFDSSKQSNIRNVGNFFKQGHLSTAEKLARLGVKEMMKEFPSRDAILRHSTIDNSPQN